MNRSCLLLTIFSVLVSPVIAQTNSVGVPKLGTFAGGPDAINLANLNVHFSLPIVSKPGRGTPFIYNLSYDSWIWSPVQYSSWLNDPNWGWTGRVEMASGYISYSVVQLSCNIGTSTDPFLYYFNKIKYNGYTDPGGTFHSFSNSAIVYDDNTCSAYGSHPTLPYSANGATIDDSGYSVYVDGGYTVRLYPKSGGVIFPPLQNQTATAGRLTDYNGNQITSLDGNNFTDTLGTTALSISGVPSGGAVTYTYQVSSGTAAVTVTYQTYTVHTTFGCTNVTDPTISNVWLPITISRPEGSFQVQYEQTPGFPAGFTTARVSQLSVPSGATINYTYNSTACDGSATSLTRTISGGIDNAGTWTYTRSGNTTTVLDPLGNTTVLQFQGLYETERDVYQGAVAPQNLLRTIYTCYNGSTYPCNSTAVAEPVGQVAVTTNQNGMYRQSVSKYDSHGMTIETDIYDFGSGAPGPLISKTSTTYATIQNPVGTIYDRPLDTKTFKSDGSTIVAETQYVYDGPMTQTSGVPQHDYTSYPASMTARGNPTSIKKWRNTDGTWLLTVNTYDDLGNLLTTTDPGGHVTSFSYIDNYNDNVNHNSMAFATQATLPNTGTAHIEKSAFYYPSGLLYKNIDQNNQSTTYLYDSSLRLIETDYADGGKTTVQYPPNSNQIWTWRYKDATNHTDFREHVDGLGRIDRVANNSSTTWEMTDTCFDSAGRLSFASYPYSDPAGWGHAKVCSGAGDTYGYDGMSRLTNLAHSDGTHIDTSYYGRATQIVDEGNGSARSTRISQVDGLGRPTYTCEITSSALISSGSPASCGLDMTGNPQGYLTSYSYSFDSSLNSVVQVTQGSLTNRQFTYNSFAQLTQIFEPETWASTSFVYDSEGKLFQRVRPTANQGSTSVTTTTSYGYDALHRLKTVTYSDGTLPLSFNYDETTAWSQSITNPTGRLTTAYAGALPGTAGSLVRYDPVGRVAANWQCTPSNCGSSAWYLPYGYDIAGDLTSSSNGNGINYAYTYNAVARFSQLSSSYVDTNHPATLLSNVQYNALGVASSDTLGNGFNESFGYSSRGQLTSVSASDPTATPATGTVTINGSEQSQTTTSGSWAPGTGWVRIDGSEASTTVCDDTGRRCHTVWDSGTVTITVNGHSDSSAYGSTDTNSSVAAALVSSINNDSAAVVTASQNGNYVNLTSKTNGASTNYSLSATSSTNDFTDFGGPSFVAATSGAHLTGGSSQTTTTVYDSGTVSVTVNGTTSTTSYGQNDTASSVASSLAGAVNANSPWVTASATGNVITLTTRALGTGSNYGFSASSSGSFTPVSFSPSPSGGNLTGSSGGTAYTLTTNFEPNGNLLSAADSANGSWTFGYDPLNRLSSASKSGGTSFTFDTDRFSNRWHQNPVGQGAQLSFDTTSNHIAAGNGVAYDAAGNLTNDGVHTYSYDAEGRVVRVDGGTTATYTYDAFGKRVRKATNSGTWDYIFDLGGKAITEIVAGTTTTNRTEVWLGDRHLTTYNFGDTYFTHTDWLGTERVRTNHAAVIAETCTSNVYGDAQVCQGTDVSPIHFAGMEYDAETGLYHTLYRYYNPRLGVWTTSDPASLTASDPGDPQSWNRYAYVTNEPLGTLDPLGLAGDKGSEPAFHDWCSSHGYDPELCAQSLSFSDWGPHSGNCISDLLLGATLTVPGSFTYKQPCPPIPEREPREKVSTVPDPPLPAVSENCRITDPILGALEVKVKFGPEAQIGPTKAGASLYYNVTTHESGSVGEVNLLGVVSVQADHPTPDSGDFIGGGPENIRSSFSVLGFQHDFSKSSTWRLNPSKSFTMGAQLILGFEVGLNSDKGEQIRLANERCKAHGRR